MAEELRIHREMTEASWREAGASEKEANDKARQQFGSEALALEESRGIWRFNLLEELSQDVRYASRAWLRNAGFAVTVIATIGLALGLNTALFTAFDLSIPDSVLAGELPRGVGDGLGPLRNLRRLVLQW